MIDTASVDMRARKILFDAFWSSAGWRDPMGPVSEADFAYARDAGWMFDPIPVRHDDIQRRLMLACRAVGKRRAANSFLASLSTRRLDWRSALGSYAVFHRMPEHAPYPDTNWARSVEGCAFCHLTEAAAEDINVLSFERWKWGGVRHDCALYAALDLEWLLRDPEMTPTAEDIGIFRAMLAAITAVPENTSAVRLYPSLSRLFPTNKSECGILVEILGYCGLIATEAQPGYQDVFVPYDKRESAPRAGDMRPPANWWRGRDGINAAALSYYFGHVLDDRDATTDLLEVDAASRQRVVPSSDGKSVADSIVPAISVIKTANSSVR